MAQQPPLSANVTPSLLWTFFSPVGRISREPYWLGFFIIWIVIGIAANTWVQTIDVQQDLDQFTIATFMESNPLLPLLFLVLQWIELALVIKRLQDRDFSGFLSLLVFVPFFSLFMILALGFMPGTDGPNRYGPEPNSYFRRNKV